MEPAPLIGLAAIWRAVWRFPDPNCLADQYTNLNWGIGLGDKRRSPLAGRFGLLESLTANGDCVFAASPGFSAGKDLERSSVTLKVAISLIGGLPRIPPTVLEPPQRSGPDAATIGQLTPRMYLLPCSFIINRDRLY